MSLTDVNAISNQIQKFWSPLFTKELRESLLLGALVDKKYQGDLKMMGDTVYVSQINAPTGQLKTVGTDADTFDSETVSTSRISIQANKRAVAAFEIADLVELQSQLGGEQSELRDSLRFAAERQINDYLYSIISPSASAPDHILSGVTDFNASQLLAVRLLAAQAKWRSEGGWWILADPSYYNDLLSAQTLTSADYVGGDQVVVGGKIATQRFGFNIIEDNSLPTDTAYAFHPDFMHLVMQQEARFKVSDLHSNKQLGYLLSVDMVFGAAQGISGDKKVIKIYNT